MLTAISCSCGYSGLGRMAGEELVCPLCGEPAPPAAVEKKHWRIPCPNGHVFRLTEERIGSPLVCPKCNASFVPTIGNSLEQRETNRLRRERKEAKFAQQWLYVAVLAAVVFGAFIVSLMVMSH